MIEGTNAFVYDVNGKKLEELEDWESGATSVIVTGTGVESLGNCPDIYVDGIFTVVPKDKRQEFIDNPMDPELTAAHPDKIEEVLIRIADANGITVNDLEVVLMDRARETERLDVLRRLKEQYPGLELVAIKDGTVAHGLLSTFGRREGRHKVLMTVGGAPEGFLNLAVAGIFKEQGAAASIRICSKNVNKTPEGAEARCLSRRYDFSSDEKDEIKRLRPDDWEKIINGEKLFTQEDVKGDVKGSFSFITSNGVFGVEGVRKLDDGSYKVVILRVEKVEGDPCAWFEDKVFTPEKLEHDEETAPAGSHLTKAQVPVVKEELIYSVQLDKNGVLFADGIPGGKEEEIDGYMDRLRFELNRLKHIYGLGLYTMIDEIRIVENLENKRLYPEGRSPLASFGDGVLKIDRLLFDYGPYILFEELEHEFLESIVGVIPGSNHAISDVVSTVRNVRRFLGLTPDEQEAFLDVLRGENPIDPDGEYLALLERLRAVKEDEIIAGVIRYVMRTKLYENVRWQLGLPEELARDIRDIEPRLDDTLAVFNEIAEAKKVTEGVKEVEELAIKVVKTFTGVRIQGLDRLSRKLAGMIAGAVKIASKLNRIASFPLAMTERNYCIVVDKERIPEGMGDEWIEAIGRLEEKGVFKVGYSLVEALKEYKPENVIHLIDPADIKREEEMQKGILYLPMPYLRSSLYMAAVVVVSGGEVSRLNPLVKGLIGDLYGQILGRGISEDDLEALFKRPWEILPEIRSVLREINNLRKALMEIEKAA